MDEPQKPDTVPENEIKTNRLDTGKFNPEIREKIEALRNTYRSGDRKLTLLFPDEKEPTVLEVSGTISLGRTDLSTGIHPTIDLTPHHGALLGVSRYHAEITPINGKFHIKDLGSTNGTRINDNQIQPYRQIPFKTGDVIRLGHLNIIVG